MPQVDQKVDEFQLLSVIANGHSSQIWEVRDAGGGIHAIKLLRPDFVKDPAQVNTLKHEARVAKAIEHPSIIRVHRFVKSKPHCYMLMEYFKCPNLKNSLANERSSLQARLPRLIEQLSIALGYMHEKGWLHHDLKPDNILFSASGELKVVDFSLAMRRKGSLGTMVGGKVKTVQGTRTYIAPETIKKQYPTPQTDMYSMGVTLFEAMTGQPPFVADNPDDLLRKHLHEAPANPSSYNPNVTPEADKAILRLLSKKPEGRPADMSELAAAFRSIKIFKEDPGELSNQERERMANEAVGLNAGSRLDSRADAKRSELGVEAPARPGPRMPTARALEIARKAGLELPEYLREKGVGEQQAPEPQQWPAGWDAYAAQGYQQPYPQGYPQQQYWPQQPQAPYPQQVPYPQHPQGEYPQAPYPPPPQHSQQPPAEGYYQYPQQPAPQAPGPGHYPQQPNPAPQAGPPQAPGTPSPGQSDDPVDASAAPAGSEPEPPEEKAGEKSKMKRADEARAERQWRASDHIPPGQGRGRERHPTQDDVEDPDSIPLMDELPDVL